MLELTNKNFEKEVLESKIPVMVDFGALWCPPCRLAEPVLEELAKEYEGKIKVAKVDVDQSSEIAQKYSVMSVPTVIFFKSGKEVEREVGFPGKEGYEKLIKKALGN